MITHYALALLIGLVGLATPASAQDEPKSKAGPKGFPLPADAGEGAPAPGGGDKILVFKVPRGAKVIADEERGFLKKEGWTIDSDETSPRGAIRLQVTKGDVKIKASITGDDKQAAIIVTLP
jgi:hypothetical protein